MHSIFRTDFPGDIYQKLTDSWQDIRDEWLANGDSSLSLPVPFPMNSNKQYRKQPKLRVWNLAGINSNGEAGKTEKVHAFAEWADGFIFDNDKYVEYSWKRFPKTMALFQSLPEIVTVAAFNTMEPGTQIAPHKGADVGLMRAHICIDVPEGNECKLMIQDTNDPTKTHTKVQKNGDIYFFDDTPLHWAGNMSDEERTIILFDFVTERAKDNVRPISF